MDLILTATCCEDWHGIPLLRGMFHTNARFHVLLCHLICHFACVCTRLQASLRVTQNQVITPFILVTTGLTSGTSTIQLLMPTRIATSDAKRKLQQEGLSLLAPWPTASGVKAQCRMSRQSAPCNWEERKKTTKNKFYARLGPRGTMQCTLTPMNIIDNCK